MADVFWALPPVTRYVIDRELPLYSYKELVLMADVEPLQLSLSLSRLWATRE